MPLMLSPMPGGLRLVAMLTMARAADACLMHCHEFSWGLRDCCCPKCPVLPWLAERCDEASTSSYWATTPATDTDAACIIGNHSPVLD